MFHMNQNLKVVLAVEPVDLRKSLTDGIIRCVIRAHSTGRMLSQIPEKGSRCL